MLTNLSQEINNICKLFTFKQIQFIQSYLLECRNNTDKNFINNRLYNKKLKLFLLGIKSIKNNKSDYLANPRISLVTLQVIQEHKNSLLLTLYRILDQNNMLSSIQKKNINLKPKINRQNFQNNDNIIYISEYKNNINKRGA